VVARDSVVSAGAPFAVRLRPERRVVARHGVGYVDADVVDRHGVVVPDADDLIHWTVRGGALVGLDNGREEDAEGYKGSAHTAFKGRALAIVQAAGRPRPIRVTARANGLRPGSATLLAAGGRAVSPVPRQPVVAPVPVPPGAVADASYSGAPATVPQAMLDGNPGTAWSNFYVKSATALLPPFSLAHAAEWVSVKWPAARTVSRVTASFVADATHQPPAALAVSYWNGQGFVAVAHPRTVGGTVQFDPVSTTAIRLDMTSRAPNTDHGFLAISSLNFN
jgi:beta-galactosidase